MSMVNCTQSYWALGLWELWVSTYCPENPIKCSLSILLNGDMHRELFPLHVLLSLTQTLTHTHVLLMFNGCCFFKRLICLVLTKQWLVYSHNFLFMKKINKEYSLLGEKVSETVFSPYYLTKILAGIIKMFGPRLKCLSVYYKPIITQYQRIQLLKIRFVFFFLDKKTQPR